MYPYFLDTRSLAKDLVRVNESEGILKYQS